MKRLIECVPNFSEGRDAAKVDAIVTAMSSVPDLSSLGSTRSPPTSKVPPRWME